MKPSSVKRQLLTLLLVVLIIPATVVGYSFWVDWRYIEPCQKVTRGDSEEHVLASLGRPHRAVIERSDKASWESEHKIDWYDAESVKQFRYVPFSITREEYGIGFDSSGHAVSKIPHHVTVNDLTKRCSQRLAGVIYSMPMRGWHASTGRSNRFAGLTGRSSRLLKTRALLSLIVDNHLRRFAQLKLTAHFLETRSESLNLFLLLGYGRFLLCSARL